MQLVNQVFDLSKTSSHHHFATTKKTIAFSKMKNYGSFTT